jgi:hypothetical protein
MNRGPFSGRPALVLSRRRHGSAGYRQRQTCGPGSHHGSRVQTRCNRFVSHGDSFLPAGFGEGSFYLYKGVFSDQHSRKQVRRRSGRVRTNALPRRLWQAAPIPQSGSGFLPIGQPAGSKR